MQIEMAENPITKLTKDLRKVSVSLTLNEVRYLVDSYYQIQEWRKAAGNQSSALEKSNEPHQVITWLSMNSEALEGEIKKALATYSQSTKIGRWSESNIGIGPVISAGLMAHINIEKAPHAGNIWSFAGLNPTKEWKKGQKRPYNADLKTLCWKIGQSFLKQSNRENCFYGHLLRKRWEWEKEQNAQLKYKEQAAAKLVKFNIGKNTDAYKAYSIGLLPPAHILQRACRWSVKLFLCHWHHVAYEIHYGKPPAIPWILDPKFGGHTDRIDVPNWPML